MGYRYAVLQGWSRKLFDGLRMRNPLGVVTDSSYSLGSNGLPWSTHHAWPLVVELPAGDQVLHRDCVIAPSQSHAFVHLMRRLDLLHVDLDAEARLLRHLHHAADDLQRLLRQPLAVLPDPVRVDCG